MSSFTQTVLIADDEELLLFGIRTSLKFLKPSLRVLTAINGKEAIDQLASHQVDLLVTDLRMPVLDGLKVLEYVRANHPQLRVLVMTAFGSPETEKRLNDLGRGDFYLRKPLSVDTLAGAVLATLEREQKILGTLEVGVPLTTLLQLVELEGKTTTLRLQAGSKEGELHFRSGQLMHATALSLPPAEAVREILSWPDVTVEVHEVCEAEERTIRTPLADFLMSQTRDRSNSARLKRPRFDAPAEDAEPETEDAAVAEPEAQAPLDVVLPEPEPSLPQAEAQALEEAPTSTLAPFPSLDGFFEADWFSLPEPEQGCPWTLDQGSLPEEAFLAHHSVATSGAKREAG